MKKASKAIAFAMASAMAVSMAACGGSASSTASGATAEDSASATGNGSYDQVTYAYATFNNIPTEEDLDVVEEEINKITREKIGAEITLKPISIADYVNKVSTWRICEEFARPKKCILSGECHLLQCSWRR